MAMGRPRTFDVDKALDSALLVFWKKGYEGTTLPDLTEAMGINRPSLYAAFGNKENLFRKALDRYSEKGAFFQEALNEPTSYKVVEKLLYGAADIMTEPGNPRGCLAVQGALACGEEADPIRQELIARRAEKEKALRDRFKRAKKEGDLPADADPTALARFVATFANGMSVQAAGGATRKDLRKVVEIALQCWPD